MSTLATVELSAQQAAGSGEVVLEDSTFLVAFDAGTGALTRMVRKSTGWAIQRRPELGSVVPSAGSAAGSPNQFCPRRKAARRER